VKKLVILVVLLLLSACNNLYVDEQDNGQVHPVDANDTVAPHYDEIEELLTQIELDVGLGNLTAASSNLNELMQITYGHEVTEHQQARINTMTELLTDIQAYEEYEDNEEQAHIFSGSDAAAKVMNWGGEAPVGYTFVYHSIPSFIGSDGLGYYVFLVPSDQAEMDDMDDMDIKETFFVTDSGEILTFD